MKKSEIEVGGHYLARVRGIVKPLDHIKEEDDVRAEDSEEGGTQEEGKQCSDPTASLGSTDAESAESGSITSEEGEQRPDPTVGVQAAEAESEGASSANAQDVSGGIPSLAARIAASRTANWRRRGDPIGGKVPNEEQEDILDIVGEPGQKVIVVVAGAGSGKTTTLKMIDDVGHGRSQYTAFNKSLVNDSKSKFKRAKCNTTHSLAWGPVGHKYAHRLESGRMRSEQIARILGISDLRVVVHGTVDETTGEPRTKLLKAGYLAGQVMEAVRRFTQTADHELGGRHIKWIPDIDVPVRSVDDDGQVTERRSSANNDRVKAYLLPFCHRAWADLSATDGTLPFYPDVYVKVWQLGREADRPIISADDIYLDEYQDTAPVFLDILMQQKHARLIMVGDDNQRIYSWRGAINAGDYFPDAPRGMLSQSYRFGQCIADVANSVLRTLDEPTRLVMRGNPDIPSRVAPVEVPRCYLYRTNAGALGRVMAAIEEGKRPHLIADVTAIISWCQAALDLQAGRGTSHHELGCFDSWEEVEEYSKSDEGADLRLMVKIVNAFGADKILSAMKGMPKEADADLVVSTAHKSKGREWATVKLGGDFPLPNRMADEDRRLLYVALTRAELTLDISECPPFCGGKERDGGEDGSGAERDVPGLEIEYTVPMPTEAEQAAWLAAKLACPSQAPPAPLPAPAREAAPLPPARPNAAPRPTQAAENGTPAGGFTWCKHGEAWCVRGPADAAIGSKVTVTRRDGSTSDVVIKGVVKKWQDAWVYEV